ncbi:MAG: alanine--tRNA ligase, partial [Chloroflexi bacterium]|nr:alanine--tRNA ligase [Chloroflexota bacterium]
MDSNQFRESYLQFFEARGHTRVHSSSLVPADPTLLFVNAGMVQFKDVFLGLEKRPYSRATSSQKCMRVAGKHNDFETVGRDGTHHTFFEMLGNFSFGDYFKADAIPFAWEYLTRVLDLPADRMYPTVYTDDDEAAALWAKVKGIPESQVIRLGEKDNFWAMGDTGPCGPCSEIHLDRSGTCRWGHGDCLPNCECGRWVELWNLVFMQFNRDADGVMTPLPRPSIDTGAGLDRILAVLQGTESNYDTDIFAPPLRVVAELRGAPYVEAAPEGFSYRVIADHSRAAAFLIADGILPANEGHGYVLRRVLRRAIRHGHLLGFREPFMAQTVAAVAEVMGQSYPELVDQAGFIRRVVVQEEERFLQTLDAGTERLQVLFADLESRGERIVPGRETFKLYDTFGFPLDITRDMAEERGLTVDEVAYNQAMAEQQQRARAAQRFGLDELAERYRPLDLPPTTFLGYETLAADGVVQTIMRAGEMVSQAATGDEVEVVLDRTPFYGEAGGQVGDTGELVGPAGRVEVTDTRRPLPDLVVHRGRVTEGAIQAGQTVRASVTEGRRLDIARNHTATHLLQKALQEVLG